MERFQSRFRRELYENWTEYLNDLGFKTEFEVINANPDTTSPEIIGFLSEDKFYITNEDETFDLSVVSLMILVGSEIMIQI